MKLRSIFTFLLIITLNIVDVNGQSQSLERPKLVVGIVVDQMRWDYLYRYYDRFQENGFKRIINEGFSCDNTIINYLPTYTAIGHTSVYTGSIPAIHGITGNNFIIKKTGESMYCTEDSSVKTIGSNSDAGQMSPKNLLATTITDELKLATNFRSKVIGISIKDRGGILPAGHAADAAYWFDDESGSWITSSWYMDALPDWVVAFNNRNLPKKYLQSNWDLLYPIDSYQQSSVDDSPYEGKLDKDGTPTLPVNTSKLYKSKGAGLIRSTPFGNSLTIEMAKEAISQEELGADQMTDFLAVSFSSTDYIGHLFGINSVEVEDAYLRLDKELGAFLEYLDENVGVGDYTLFLTADHGAASNAQYLNEAKLPGGIWPAKEVINDLNQLLQTKYGKENLIASLLNYQIHFNDKLINESGLNRNDIKADCIEFLENNDGINFIVDLESDELKDIPQIINERIVNGYNASRSGSIQLVLKPGWYSGKLNATGTTHGSWNSYDAHIPLLWIGWGVKQGRSNRLINITDIAPTLSGLLHVQFPSGNVGTPILEVLKN